MRLTAVERCVYGGNNDEIFPERTPPPGRHPHALLPYLALSVCTMRVP